jgi:hypothetical protein
LLHAAADRYRPGKGERELSRWRYSEYAIGSNTIQHEEYCGYRMDADTVGKYGLRRVLGHSESPDR